LDDAKNEIDKISTGLVVQITDPGTITINSFLVEDKSVDTQTWIQLDMTPSARYSSGGYIELVTSSAYLTFTSVVVCNTVYGLTGTGTCNRVSSSNLKFVRDISSSSSISISLFKLQNTLGVIQHPGIDIYLKEADGSVVALTKAAL